MTNEEFIKDCYRTIALIRKLRAEISGDKKINYVDLGLPSGTLRADTNEEGFYTFDEAVEKFGNSLPTIIRFTELKDFCDWTWDNEKKGYKVTGRNGNSIFLPAKDAKSRNCTYFWSKTARNGLFAYILNFRDNTVVSSDCGDRCSGGSVCLVKSK